MLHLYSAFLGTQSTLHGRGESPQPPPVCSIHLDDAMAAILRQNAHHTPAYWWRGDRVMKPISVWGWLGGHDGQRPMGKCGQDAGVTPLLFFEGHPGIFLMTAESQDLGLTSQPKDIRRIALTATMVVPSTMFKVYGLPNLENLVSKLSLSFPVVNTTWEVFISNFWLRNSYLQ